MAAGNRRSSRKNGDPGGAPHNTALALGRPASPSAGEARHVGWRRCYRVVG